MSRARKPGEVSVLVRLGTVILAMAGIVAALGAVVATGIVKLPGLHVGAARTGHVTLAADRSAAVQSAAEKQWAASTCTNILQWKNQVKHDGTSLSLGLGPVARIQDAIAATKRMLNEQDKLGLPPGAHAGPARADAKALRSDIESHLADIERAATSVAGGNLAALPTLLGDIQNYKALGSRLSEELSHVVSADLGLSLAETSACRQLVGITI